VKWICARPCKELDRATTLYKKKISSSVMLLRFFCFEHKHFKFYTGANLTVEFPKIIHVCLGIRISFHWFLTSTWAFYNFPVFWNMYLLLCANCHCTHLKFLMCLPFIRILCCVLSKLACDNHGSVCLYYLFIFVSRKWRGRIAISLALILFLFHLFPVNN
jgi:hypothetical protein